MSSSSEQFKRALNYVQNGPKASKPLSNEIKLKFYALYKQITEGPNKKPKPGMFDFVARAKWDAWKKLGNMSKEEAEKEYVRVLDSVSPKWREWNQNQSSTTTNSSTKQQQQQQQQQKRQGKQSSNKTKAPVSRNKKPSASPSTFNPHLLDGKVAFVTGGGSGICKGITEMLMRHGAKAVIMSRNMDKLKAAAKEMEKNTGSTCFPVSADVRDPEGVAAAVDKALAKFGRIDILINGAAGNFLASAEKLSYNAFQTVMNIDTVGTFNVSKIVYQKYLKEHGGSIVNISMTLHWTGMPLQVHAGAAKGGVDAMTKHLAVEWGLNNVRVNALAVGPIAGTEGFRRLLPDEVKNAVQRSIPLQRWGSVEDIGNATLYLVSDAASWINGSILTVDGGSWMTTNGLGYPDMFSRL